MNELWYKVKFAIQDDLDKLKQKQGAQNAADTLNATIKEAEQQTASVGKLLNRHRMLRDEISKELLAAEQLTEKRTTQLELAEVTQDEALIRYAKDEVESYRARRDELRVLLEETTESMIELERRFESMKHKVKDMQIRRFKLMGEENIARANQQMDRIFSSDPDTSSEESMTVDESNTASNESMRQRLEKLSVDEAARTEIV